MVTLHCTYSDMHIRHERCLNREQLGLYLCDGMGCLINVSHVRSNEKTCLISKERWAQTDVLFNSMQNLAESSKLGQRHIKKASKSYNAHREDQEKTLLPSILHYQLARQHTVTWGPYVLLNTTHASTSTHSTLPSIKQFHILFFGLYQGPIQPPKTSKNVTIRRRIISLITKTQTESV